MGQLHFDELYAFLGGVKPAGRGADAGRHVLGEIRARLKLLLGIGLDYLSFNRRASTLSGGESQRIRLSTQIGSGLMGMLYVLDEPSIGHLLKCKASPTGQFFAGKKSSATPKQRRPGNSKTLVVRRARENNLKTI